MVHALDLLDNGFDRLVLTLGVVRLLEIAAKEESDGLIKTRRKTTLVILYNIIAVVTGLPVDQFGSIALGTNST